MRIIVVLLVALAVSSCSSPRRSPPLVGPVVLTKTAEKNGQRAFMKFCNQCHPGGDAGLGPALNNKPLPGPLMKLQTRSGIGAMPAIKKEYLSDTDLDDLVLYLQTLRKMEPPPS